MVSLLKAIGGLVIALAIIAAIVMLVVGGIEGFIAGLTDAISAAFGGVFIIAFALMLEHLETISQHSAQQTELLAQLVRKPSTAEPSHKAPGRNSLEQLAGSNFRFKEI
ncbi:MAG TPA: hypothetical protein VGC14_23245 [Rhizobium sp.]